MRINRFEELRRIHTEISERKILDSDCEIKQNETMLLETVYKIMELGLLARKEGLLALEEAVNDISLESQEEELQQLITLLVDGTEPDILEGIGWSRYYSRLYHDYQALKYFIYLEGTLSIQAGDNPRILEEKLKAMLPRELYIKYTAEQREKELEKEKQEKQHLIENLCKGERLWNVTERGYYVFKLTDYIVCELSDKGLQRAMREIDNLVLTVAMKGMNGKARRHIFDNLSERLGNMIAEDMINMVPIRAVDILDASQKILAVIIRLIERGEIAGNYEYLAPFFQIVQVDTKSLHQKNRQIGELKKMVEEYEQSEKMVKEIL